VAELTSYTGNSGLGLANASIPVTSAKDLDLINQTSRDVYLNGLNRNQQLFQQKIKERDQLLSAIDSGDIKVGDLLEEDTPLVKEGLDKLDVAFENRIKKGMNDLDAAREYKKALREAQDRVTQAQGRKVFYDSESGAIGQETLPRKQDARKKNLDTVIKGGFWKDITPYQQTQDLDIQGSILSTAANISTPYTDPKTLTKGTRTEFDYGKTLDANVNNFLNDANKRYDQQQLVREIQELDPQTFGKTMESMNSRIAEYNKLKNLMPNTPGYVEPIKFDIVQGRGIIAEKMPDFSAKYTLANQKPFSSGTSEFDKDRASFALGQERNKIAAQNAGANQLRARTYAALQNKKLSQMEAEEKQSNTIWSGWVEKIKVQNNNDDIVNPKDLPQGYRLIGGLNKEGKPIELKPLKKDVVKDKKGKVLSSTEYYDTRYKQDGKELAKADLKKEYDRVMGELKKDGKKSSTSYNDFIKNLVRNGVLEMEVIGENGTADFNTAFQTVRALSNKLSTKGEEPVFGSETTETEIIE
jgi:hypothetical protein